MQRKSIPFLFFFLVSALSFGQGAHRISQVLVRGNNVAANVSPFAKIRVCVVGSGCNTEANVYADEALTQPLTQPLTADASGNYSYYIANGCVDEQISAPGQGLKDLPNVCPFNGTAGGGASFPNTSNIVVNTSTTASRNATTTDVSTLLKGSSGCTDPTKAYNPQTNTCIAATGGTPPVGSLEIQSTNADHTLLGHTNSFVDSYTNPQTRTHFTYTPKADAGIFLRGDYFGCNWSSFDPYEAPPSGYTSGIINSNCMESSFRSLIAGFNFNGGGGSPTFSLANGYNLSAVDFGQGLAAGLNLSLRKLGQGDAQSLSINLEHMSGGDNGGGSEGDQTDIRSDSNEYLYQAQDNLVAKAPDNSNLFIPSLVNFAGVGRYVRDQNITYATNITLSNVNGYYATFQGANLSAYVDPVRCVNDGFDAPIKATGAYTTITTNLTCTGSVDIGKAESPVTVTLTGTPTVGQILKWSSTQHDQAFIKTVTPVGGGVYTITADVRYPHSSGLVMIGSTPTTAFDPYHSRYDMGAHYVSYPMECLGVLDATHAVCGLWVQLSYVPVGRDGSFGNARWIPVGLGTGGTVSGGVLTSNARAVDNYVLPALGHNLYITNSDNPAFIGKTCSNARMNADGFEICNISGVDGQSYSSSIIPMLETQYGNGQGDLYPIAQMTSLHDDDGSGSWSGSVNVEPVINWTVGDVLEYQHGYAGGGSPFMLNYRTLSPRLNQDSNTWQIALNANAMYSGDIFHIKANPMNAETWGKGGQNKPVYLFKIDAPLAGIWSGAAPVNTGAFAEFACPDGTINPGTCGGTNYYYRLFDFGNGDVIRMFTGQNKISFDNMNVALGEHSLFTAYNGRKLLLPFSGGGTNGAITGVSTNNYDIEFSVATPADYCSMSQAAGTPNIGYVDFSTPGHLILKWPNTPASTDVYYLQCTMNQ